jgi:hypothetical protein
MNQYYWDDMLKHDILALFAFLIQIEFFKHIYIFF